METENTAVVTSAPTSVAPLQSQAMVPTVYDFAPKDLGEAMQLADMLSKSSMVPKDFQGRSGNCFIAMQMGHELGLKPIQALQSIAVINGRPAVWGDAMLALVVSSGVCEYVREPQPTMEEGICVVKRKGQQEVTRKFTAEDMTRAKLGEKDIWKQYRPRMLQMRARALALRDVFPDVLKGMPIAEEVRDYIEPEKDITSQSTEERQPAQSKSDKIAADLKNKAVKLPSVDDIIKEFDAATDPEAINAVVAKATRTGAATDDAGRAKMSAAYHAAVDRFRKTQAPIAPTIEEVRQKLAAATNVDEVDVAGSMIDGLDAADDVKEALRADYKSLRDDFSAKL